VPPPKFFQWASQLIHLHVLSLVPFTLFTFISSPLSSFYPEAKNPSRLINSLRPLDNDLNRALSKRCWLHSYKGNKSNFYSCVLNIDLESQICQYLSHRTSKSFPNKMKPWY
jgi:hypothetical protein